MTPTDYEIEYCVFMGAEARSLNPDDIRNEILNMVLDYDDSEDKAEQVAFAKRIVSLVHDKDFMRFLVNEIRHG